MTRQTLKQASWDDLTFKDKMLIFNYWTLLQFIANVFLIYGGGTYFLIDNSGAVFS